jgi:uncharacterized protein YggL (DUF469 family)
MGNGTRWTAAQLRQHETAKEVAPAQVGKYGNKKVTIDGFVFDSIKEGEYYKSLVILQRVGEIKKFQRQTVYKLAVNGVHICKYVADFVVWNKDGTVEVVDVKGAHTAKLAVFRIKAALMLAVYGIVVKIV